MTWNVVSLIVSSSYLQMIFVFSCTNIFSTTWLKFSVILIVSLRGPKITIWLCMRTNSSTSFISVNQSFYELPFVSMQFWYLIKSNEALNTIDAVKYLGITLSWSQHVQCPQWLNIASWAKAVASWAPSAFWSRDKLTMLTFISLWFAVIYNIAALYGIHKKFQTWSETRKFEWNKKIYFLNHSYK